MIREYDPPRLPDAVDTSSLGLVWPPNYEGSFNRVRGAWPRLLTTADLLASSIKELFSIINSALDSGKRCVIKAVVSAWDIQSTINHAHGVIEAAVPFVWNGRERYFVYIGVNPQGRNLLASRSTSQIGTYLDKRVEYREDNLTKGQLVERMITAGCLPKITTVDDLNSLAALYATFGWKENEVRQMLESGENKILLAQQEDQAIGAVMIERDRWFLGLNGNLDLAELTEGIVRPDWQRNGIIHGLCVLACRLALEENDLVYSENNILTTGQLPQRLGMLGTPLGLRVTGILRAHVPVEDGSGDQLSCFYPAAIDILRAKDQGYFSPAIDDFITNYHLRSWKK